MCSAIILGRPAVTLNSLKILDFHVLEKIRNISKTSFKNMVNTINKIIDNLIIYNHHQKISRSRFVSKNY